MLNAGWHSLALATIVQILLSAVPGQSLDCFVCSYSPLGNSSAFQDNCTPSNFTEEATLSRECQLGCESVRIYDTNGQMVSFHRNCAQGIITGSCETYKTIILTRTVCNCDWALCNKGPSCNSQALIPTCISAAVFFSRYL